MKLYIAKQNHSSINRVFHFRPKILISVDPSAESSDQMFVTAPLSHTNTLHCHTNCQIVNLSHTIFTGIFQYLVTLTPSQSQ